MFNLHNIILVTFVFYSVVDHGLCQRQTSRSRQNCPKNSESLQVSYTDSDVCQKGAPTLQDKKCRDECIKRNLGGRFGEMTDTYCARGYCTCLFCDNIGASGGGACGTSVKKVNSKNFYREAGVGAKITEGPGCGADPWYRQFTHPALCEGGHDRCVRHCQSEYGSDLHDAACEGPTQCVCLSCVKYKGPANSRRSQRRVALDQNAVCSREPQIDMIKFPIKTKPCNPTECYQKCTPQAGRYRGKEYLLAAAYCIDNTQCVCERCDEGDVFLARDGFGRSNFDQRLANGRQGASCSATVFAQFRRPGCRSNPQCEAQCRRKEGADDLVAAVCDEGSGICTCQLCK